MERFSLWFFQGNNALYVQLCVHYQEAFDPAEPVLIKSKMQHVVESKGISKNNENSGDDRVCAHDKNFCL